MAAQNYFETVENQLRKSGIDLGSLLRQVASQNSEINNLQMGSLSQSLQNHTMENMSQQRVPSKTLTKKHRKESFYDVEEFIQASRILPCLWNMSCYIILL